MPRLPRLARGPAALALCLGLALGPPTRPAAAAEQAPAAPAAARDEGHAAPKAADAAHAAASEAAHAPAATGHAAAGHDEPDILRPEPSLAIWTVVVFLGLLAVLGRFAWKPLLTALHGREEHLEHVLVETERARNESEQLLAEHRRRMAAAEDQVRALIDEARKNAQAAGDEIIKRAQAEAEAVKARAERDIGSARDQALNDIWTKTADLAVSVAGRVLNKSMNDEDHSRLVDSAIAELPNAPDGRGGHAA